MIYQLVFSFCLTAGTACQAIPYDESFSSLEACSEQGNQLLDKISRYLSSGADTDHRPVAPAGFTCHAVTDAPDNPTGGKLQEPR